ncbi:MAG: amidase family protein, partial [Tissierellaceae bacterium]
YILTKSHAEEYYKKALKIRTLIREDFDTAFEGVDVLLLPTSTCQPFKLGERLPNPVDMYKMEEATIPASLAGLPAMSIPINHKASLPTGLQVIGKKFREEDVLKLGLAIERMVE